MKMSRDARRISSMRIASIYESHNKRLLKENAALSEKSAESDRKLSILLTATQLYTGKK